MLMALGMFVFATNSLPFDDRQRDADYRHVRSPRIGARDAVQFVGPGEDRITIAGSAPTELMDGDASLEDLRKMAATGEPWTLVDGEGRVWGSYVIERLREGARHFYPNGRARLLEFSLELSDAGEPSATGLIDLI